MDLYEYNTHPFVIKIWLEQEAAQGRRATWRGHLTHVPSGARHYFGRLSEIALLIAPYLEQMGVSLGPRWQIRRWLRQATRRKN